MNWLGIPRAQALGIAGLSLLITSGCLIQPNNQTAHTTLFVGIDASGPFKRSDHYDHSLKFLAHYIYGHLNELGGLHQPQALFVGSMGGKTQDEPTPFHPIKDFEGKTIKEIELDLKTWFKTDDTLTDFNSFFEEVARITKDRNLTLSPITMMIVSDGIPDFSKTVTNKGSQEKLYKKINLKPLEYLSRNITLRLTYVAPTIGKHWQTQVPRQRVRLWTGDADVMTKWPQYLKKGVETPEQDRFWSWLKDTVDFPVRARRV